MEMHFKSNTESISKELESYASMKLSRLTRYLDKIKSVSVNFIAGNSKRKESSFRVEIHLVAPGHELHAVADSNSFRAAMDTAMEQLKAQLTKLADKRTTHQRADVTPAKQLKPRTPRERTITPWDAAGPRFAVESYALKPMSPQEAVAELKLNGGDVLVFVNQSGTVNAMVRRGAKVTLYEPERGD